MRDSSSTLAPRLDVVAAEPSNVSLETAEVWRDGDGGVFAYCQAEDERYRMELPGLVTFRFDRGADRVVAAPRSGIHARAVAEAYWHAALPLVLQARGSEVLHASAVLTPRGVVAFCGLSRSGKSTIAYGLHRSGYGLWADDAVALEVSGPAITALSLPFDVRLRPATAALFGLGPRAARLADPAGSGDGARPARAALAAVCVLERTRDAALRILKPSAAYPNVLAHAFCFSLEDAARKRLMLERYLALVAHVPVFELGIPDGLGRLPEILDVLDRAFGDSARDAR
jgi:hypothetical protein